MIYYASKISKYPLINTALLQLHHFKTHHYIILFVRPLHSEPGMESYCSSSIDQLSWQAYDTIISQVWPSCRLWGILIIVGWVLSQFTPSGLSILSFGKGQKNSMSCTFLALHSYTPLHYFLWRCGFTVLFFYTKSWISHLLQGLRMSILAKDVPQVVYYQNQVGDFGNIFVFKYPLTAGLLGVLEWKCSWTV